MSLHDIKLEAAVQALRKHRGNRAHASKELQISIRCLQKWIWDFDQFLEFRPRGASSRRRALLPQVPNHLYRFPRD